MRKRVYRFEYDGYIKDCRKCGETFDSGFYVPQKTKTLKCPNCGHEDNWDEFLDMMKFDLGMIEDRFYRHKSDYLDRLDMERFDNWINSLGDK